MGGASSYYAMLAVTAFFVALWLAGRLARLMHMSSILLEVGVGIVLGPAVLNLIPGELTECYYQRTVDCTTVAEQMKIAQKGPKYCDLQAYLNKDKYVGSNVQWFDGFFGNVSSVALDGRTCVLGPNPGCTDSSNRRLASGNEGKSDYDDYKTCLKEQCGLELAINCAMYPDIFTLIGHTGVAMMIFESGMHFDFEQAKVVGPKACVVAVLGTFLPIAAGTGLSAAYGFPVYPEGLAVGVSLAPTSVGIALKLLYEAAALETEFGQAVMTAAFVDDVLSLILFSVLFALQGTMTFLTFLPLILGCVFMLVAIAMAVVFWPPAITYVLSKLQETKPDGKLKRHDQVLFLLMLFVLVVYAQITHLCGTHLWGCFIAGMSFAHRHESHHIWVRQVKRVTSWFIRIFFASTLAWAIPVEQLFSWPAFWKGTIMGIGPCILTKVLCAPFMGRAKWVIGWAMVGRAEFAYFIGIMAKSLKMIPDDLFAVLIWALVYATIFAPLIFRFVLQRFVKAVKDQEEREATEAAVEADPSNIARQTSACSRQSRISDVKPTRVSGAYSLSMPDIYLEEKRRSEEQDQEEQRAKLERLDACETELYQAKQENEKLKTELAKYMGATAREAEEVRKI